ncbi:MAG TPA: DUF3300 domain-containing protein [Syntrophales bacterium]|nr:DUF3300 domain-containing protein [Syntrophales bacterium]
MIRNGIKGFLLIFIVCLWALLSIQAWAYDPFPTDSSQFTDQELDNILAPIALYPDPLLAQMLPASTYPDEIADAYDWLNGGGPASAIDLQNWDESVKAIAHYPNILKMMAENGDWTADLGDAFLNQPEDVARSIQLLRWQARDRGNLESTSQQTVAIDGDYIEIIPAQPQYIYVPLYDPSIIYVQRWYPGRAPFITFGLGLMIGGWLTMDFDWGHHHVIYHGWNRPGWVNHARPYVHVRNVYINRSRPFINQAWRHDASHGSPDSYRASHPISRPGIGKRAPIPEIKGRASTPPKPPTGVFGPRGDTRSFSNRGRESRGVGLAPPKAPTQDIGKRPTTPAPGVSQRPAQPAPSISKQPLLPGPGIGKSPPPQARPARESVQPPVQPPKTPSVTFGGYRGANEARQQSLRGQASRQSNTVIRPSAAPPTRSTAPERKDGAKGGSPAGKDDTRGRSHR